MTKAEIFKQIESFGTKVSGVIGELSEYGKFEFDHINVHASSKDNYTSIIEMLSDDIDKIKEIPHDGRHIFVALLKEPVQIESNLTISTIEISEPKPKHSVKKPGVDHVSFLVQDFERFSDTLHDKGYDVYDYKTIAGTKLFKLQLRGVKLEFRNRSLSDAQLEDASTDEEPETTTKETPDDELSQAQEAKVRAIADYQNLKKQVEEERKYFMTVANASLLGKILDIIDDFDRALENTESDDGIKMIQKKLVQVTKDYGLEEIKTSIGDDLNPSIHEVIGVVNEDDEKKQNKIKQIVQVGYTFAHNEQIVRPTRVIVGKKQ